MFTVIIPIDLSPTSINAAHYFASISASLSISKIILYHTHFGDMQILSDSRDDLESYLFEELQAIASQIKNKIGRDIPVQIRISGGNMFHDIVSLAEKEKADLIVMGLTDKGKLAQTVIGSNTLTVARDSPCPLLIVPEETSNSQVRKIGMAVQYKDNMESEIPIDMIQKFMTFFDADLTLINVEKQSSNYEQIKRGLKVTKEMFKNIPHIQAGLDSNNVVQAIDNYVAENNLDLLITIAHKKGFFENIFQGSTTKKLLFHTSVPVLVLRPLQND